MSPPHAAEAEYMNGDWPELPKLPPPIEELGDNPTQGQVLKALGTTLFAWGHVWPRAVQALEYLKRWTHTHDRAHELMLLPPMRDRLGSTHKQAGTVAGDVASAYEAVLRDTSTPPMAPQTLKEIIEERVAIELARLKVEEDAAKWHAVEAERKAAEEDRVARAKEAADDERKRAASAAEEKRKRDAAAAELAQFNARQRSRAKWKIVFMGLAAAGTSLGWFLEHFGK